MISAMASAGLPGLSGFVGEFLSLVGTFKASVLTAVLAGLSLIVGAGYTLWLYHKSMFKESLLTPEKIHRWEKLKDMNSFELASFVPLVIMMFVLGIYPAWWIKLIETTSAAILSKIIGG